MTRPPVVAEGRVENELGQTFLESDEGITLGKNHIANQPVTGDGEDESVRCQHQFGDDEVRLKDFHEPLSVKIHFLPTFVRFSNEAYIVPNRSKYVNRNNYGVVYS